MTTESNEPAKATESIGEAEITLEGGDCRVTIRGPEHADDATEWAKALRSAFDVWAEMERVVHASRVREIKAEQGGSPGPASAGFQTEQSAERRNGLLPGGTGAMPA
jgi:hypothetical protein